MSNFCVNKNFVDSIAERGGNTRNKLIDKILELRDKPELQQVILKLFGFFRTILSRVLGISWLDV